MIAKSSICIGNPEEKFISLPTLRTGVIKDQSSKFVCIVSHFSK